MIYLVEQKLADFLCEKWKCEMYRQKKLSQFDFIAHKDGKPKSIDRTTQTELFERTNTLQQWSA